MSKARFRKPALLFLILLFPSLLYILLSTGKHKFNKLPYLGNKTLSQTGDTIYHKINPFLFTNHQGNEVTLGQFDGKIKLISILCPSCNKGSKRVKSELAQIDLQFKEYPNLVFLNFVYKPNQNKLAFIELCSTPPNAMAEKWHFIVPDSNLLVNVAKNSLLLSDFDTKWGSDKLILADSRNQIRGIFDGTAYLQVKELIDAIKALRKEEFLVKQNIKK